MLQDRTTVRGSAGRWRRHAGLAAAIALTLGLPGTARAAEIIGSDLTGTPIGTSCTDANGCLVVQEKIGGVFVQPNARGVITQWRTRGAVGEISLEVFRHRAGVPFTEGELHATFADGSEPRVGTGAQQTFSTRVPVRAGDYIGLFVEDSGSYSHRQSPPPETNAFKPDPTVEEVDSPAGFPIELLLQARVEADADGDGLGDETQDPCVCTVTVLPPTPRPSSPDPFAAIRGRGPRVSIRRSARATRKGVVPVTVANPYAFELKGRLTLRYKGRRIGSRAYVLPAKAAKKVRVKLSRSRFRALKRRRHLKVTAAARSRAAAGRARTTRRKLKIKAPKKMRKKKKRRRSGGDTSDGTYRGRTDQGRSITIKTGANRREIRVFATTALTSSCLVGGSPSEPQNVSILPPVPFPVDRAGSFALEARNRSEDYDPKYRVKGTVTRNRVTGFFAWSRFKPFSTENCVTREIKFEATRVG